MTNEERKQQVAAFEKHVAELKAKLAAEPESAMLRSKVEYWEKRLAAAVRSAGLSGQVEQLGGIPIRPQRVAKKRVRTKKPATKPAIETKPLSEPGLPVIPRGDR